MTTATATQPDRADAYAWKVRRLNLRTDKTKFITKLLDNIRASDKRIAPFRRARLAALKAFAGPRHGSNNTATDPAEQYLSTIYSWVASICPSMRIEHILPEITSEVPGMHRTARLLGLAVERSLAEVRAEESFALALMDSFFGPGIIRIGWSRALAKGERDLPDWRQDPDSLSWERISLDSYILDPQCTHQAMANLEGHRYVLALDTADALGWDHEALVQLDDKLDGAREGDAATMTALGGYHDELYPAGVFADIYLPREGVIVTVPDVRYDLPVVLDEQPYDGPEGSPYEILDYYKVPDNPFGIAPIDASMGPHDLVNILAKKAGQQAKDAKTVYGFEPGSDEDAKRLRDAEDRGLVGMANPKGVVPFEFRGPDEQLIAAIGTFLDYQNRNGPNIQLIGGQEAKEGTLGQTQLMLSQSSGTVGDMVASERLFLGRSIKRSAWYLWSKPKTMALSLPVEGTTDVIEPLFWTKQSPEGEFTDMAFRCKARAIGSRTPEQDYQETIALVREVIEPLTPQMTAQGIYVDVAALVQQLAERRNIPGVGRWFRRGVPLSGPPPAGSGAPAASSNTTNISTGGGARPANQPRPNRPARQNTGE